MNLSTETIGVVVVTFRRQQQLIKTLKAILSQGITANHIWVINNDKDDKQEFLRKEQELIELNIIVPEENIASSGGFSLGMSKVVEAGLKWVWLFNDDSRPIWGSLNSLKNALKDQDLNSLGMVKIGNLNDQGLATLLFWKGVRMPTYVPPSESLIATDLVTFDGCLVSTNMIKHIGTCDPEYFMGTYEFDFCLRAKDYGYKIFTIPNGLIEDEKLGSVGGTPPWRQYYNTRNHLSLGLKRRDYKIIWAWIVRETKFTYSILRFQDQKLNRLNLKIKAFWHALIGKRGKTLDPLGNKIK